MLITSVPGSRSDSCALWTQFESDRQGRPVFPITSLRGVVTLAVDMPGQKFGQKIFKIELKMLQNRPIWKGRDLEISKTSQPS